MAEPTNCLRGGCWEHATAVKRKNPALCDCSRCGFDVTEDERRRALPLTRGANGLLRKIIPARGYKLVTTAGMTAQERKESNNDRERNI